MEKIIVKQLTDYLLSNSLISDKQFGFLPNRSTVTQLLDCLFSWCEALDCKSCVDIVYIDIQKCFDSISHQKLLLQLSSFGISGNLWKWIRAFLSNRWQRVKVQGSFSEYKPVLSGSIQGSCLGVVLALIYLSGSLDSTVVGNIGAASFADDGKYWQTISSQLDPIPLQDTLERFSQWANSWQLSISAQKCQVLRLGSDKISFDYSLQGFPLPRVQSSRDLGVIIDSKLKFDKQIDSMVKKTYSVLNCLFRVFICSDKEAILQGYKVIARPLLEYASCTWSPHKHLGLCNKIEGVQKYFTRRLLARLGHAPMDYESRLKFFGLELLEERRIRADLCMMYQIIHGNVSLNFNKYFELGCSTTRGHNLKVQIRTPRLVCTANTFFWRIVPIWNDLDGEVVNATSMRCFKNALAFVDIKKWCNFYRNETA